MSNELVDPELITITPVGTRRTRWIVLQPDDYIFNDKPGKQALLTIRERVEILATEILQEAPGRMHEWVRESVDITTARRVTSRWRRFTRWLMFWQPRIPRARTVRP